MGGLILLTCIRMSCYLMHSEVIFIAVARLLCCSSPTSAAYIHPMHWEVAVITSLSHTKQQRGESFCYFGL